MTRASGHRNHADTRTLDDRLAEFETWAQAVSLLTPERVALAFDMLDALALAPTPLRVKALAHSLGRDPSDPDDLAAVLHAVRGLVSVGLLCAADHSATDLLRRVWRWDQPAKAPQRPSQRVPQRSGGTP